MPPHLSTMPPARAVPPSLAAHVNPRRPVTADAPRSAGALGSEGPDNPLLRNFKRSKPRVRGRHIIDYFNLMVVGPRGSGKTSFLQTLSASLASAHATQLDLKNSLRRSHFIGDAHKPTSSSSSRSSPVSRRPTGPQSPVSPRPTNGFPSPTPQYQSAPNTPTQPAATPRMLTDGISMQTLTVDEFDEPILLNLIDTPGWVADDNGEDAARVCTNLVAFLEEQMDSRVIEELKVRRDKYAPNLIVHACLYFMDPLHNEYRATDIPIIKELGTRVNLIPVVGKSDLITLTQKLQFQLEFINSMKRHADQVSLFDLPGDSVDANESMTGDVPLTMSRDSITFPMPGDKGGEGAGPTLMMPFFLFNHEPIDPVALSAFETTGAQEKNLPGFRSVLANLARTFDKHPDFLGRCYPWGRIDCMDPDQSDFAVLRTMLLESHRDMLRQHTVSSIYEEYRCRQLQSKKRDDLLQRCGSLKLRNAFNSSALELNGHRQV
ncbi:hypothetical protein H4R33_006010 [Dimargaris cristalligena]|nr:hypothetical protein H4R33_006010 [Dimargaris cristalligena]